MWPFVIVWIVLIGINLLELLVTWRQLATRSLFAVLMGLAFINAILVVSFFMHLKYERKKLVFTLIPATIFVMIMMLEMSPDSTRANKLRPNLEFDSPAAAQGQPDAQQ
jgi:cytochrome c oxidase subunit IV